MDHAEVETLLGAYALDAVEGEEALAIEEHLLTCPRCRAELAAHQEVAAALGNFGAEAPEGLWQRIALAVEADEHPAADAQAPALSLLDGRSEPRAVVPTRRRSLAAVAGGIAAVLVVLLGLQLAHLNHELNGLQRADAARGLAGPIAALALGAHQEVQLTSSEPSRRGLIEIGPRGEAYWVQSSLPELPADKTYQVWALVGGKVVSLGLLGTDPHAYAQLRIGKGTKELMVTAEPQGGTVQPTSSVVLEASLPHVA